MEEEKKEEEMKESEGKGKVGKRFRTEGRKKGK